MLTRPDARLSRFAAQVRKGEVADARDGLRLGVDLGTANIVLAVVDGADRPVAGAWLGSCVVRDGVVIGEGANRVTLDLDPTAHAEVVAMRNACREVGDFALTGAVVYASCEPCPLCLSASLWARVDAIVHAADRHAAAAAGFDDAAFHGLLDPTPDPDAWPMRRSHVPAARSEAPFDAWRALNGRTHY